MLISGIIFNKNDEELVRRVTAGSEINIYFSNETFAELSDKLSNRKKIKNLIDKSGRNLNGESIDNYLEFVKN